MPSLVRIQLVGIFNNPGGDPADSPPRWPVTAPLGVKNESGRKYINMGVKMCVLDMGNPNLMLFFSWDQKGRCSVEPKLVFMRVGVKNEVCRKYINMGVKMCVLDMENPNLTLVFS